MVHTIVDSWTKHAGYEVDVLQKDAKMTYQPGHIWLDSQVNEGTPKLIMVNKVQLRLTQVEVSQGCS